MTLMELIIAITISLVIILIVSFFITKSVVDLNNSLVLTDSIDKSFIFRDTLDREIRWWKWIFTLYGTGNRSVIMLENIDRSEWVLYWVVDYETKKLEQDYICGDKFIWYRRLSNTELNDIQTNSWVIYNYNFFIDKIYKWMKIKDFRAELFNIWTILDLDLSIIMTDNDNNYWLNYNNIFIDPEMIFEYNLNF